MNTQLKPRDLDKNRFGVFSTVVTAFGTHLRVWVTGASGAAPSLPSTVTPEGGSWGPVIVFVVFLLVLVVRPAGIFGSPAVEKV